MKQIILAMTILCLIGPHRSFADTVCLSLDELNAALVDWYGETMVGAVYDQQEHLWISARTGTWTMASISSDGTACVTAQGLGWTDIPVVATLRD